jgi:hypothetical protein
MNAGYEPGMRVSYDAASKLVTVTFRGRVLTLKGEYETEREGIKAGEDHCRRHGWSEKPTPTVGRSMLKPRTFNL